MARSAVAAVVTTIAAVICQSPQHLGSVSNAKIPSRSFQGASSLLQLLSLENQFIYLCYYLGKVSSKRAAQQMQYHTFLLWELDITISSYSAQ